MEVRLLGGTAIWVRSPDPVRAALTREFADVDLATAREHAKGLRSMLEELGYVPDKMFNASRGRSRLYYTAADGAFHIDVFIDTFSMSHQLDLGARLTVEPVVLPAAELLLTKLQIAELNRKDASDTIMLLLGHELSSSDGDGRLCVDRVADVCAQDWGLYTTLSDNLVKTAALIEDTLTDEAFREDARTKIAVIDERLQAAPKSRAWRRRSRIGRRIRWYETPDEI